MTRGCPYSLVITTVLFRDGSCVVFLEHAPLGLSTCSPVSTWTEVNTRVIRAEFHIIFYETAILWSCMVLVRRGAHSLALHLPTRDDTALEAWLLVTS
jgi:hypothetical protein